MSKEELLSAIAIVLLGWWVYDETGRRMLDIIWEAMPKLL